MKNTFLAAVVMLALAVGVAQAGFLATDSNAMLTGSKPFSTLAAYGMPMWSADVDYAVYAPGQYAASFGSDPAPGEYIYAYQVVNVQATTPNVTDQISGFSVGLTDKDERVNVIGYEAGYGVAPATAAFGMDTTLNVPKSAVWTLNPVMVTGQQTTVLYYSSLDPPEWDNATVSGYLFPVSRYGEDGLPSPTPEPGTMAVVALGGLAALIRTRRTR